MQTIHPNEARRRRLLRLGLTLLGAVHLGATPAAEITAHHERMVRYHGRMDANVPDGAIVFIGDSLVQGLCTDAVAFPSVNFGIGGDTTAGVLARLPRYQCLRRASVIVLAVGVNDLMFRRNDEIVRNFRRILAALPPERPVVWSAVLPVNRALYQGPVSVNNERIRALNASLQAVCAADSRCVWVEVPARLMAPDGDLAAGLQDGDGIHLNGAGNEIWIARLRTAVDRFRSAQSAAPPRSH